MAHARTKKLRTIKIILGILHFLCLFGVLAAFGIPAFITAEVGSKAILGVCGMVTIMLGLVSTVVSVKHKAGLHRSMMWALIIGVMKCLNSIAPFVWTMALASILDECLISPAYENYKTALLANREMDKRGL